MKAAAIRVLLCRRTFNDELESQVRLLAETRLRRSPERRIFGVDLAFVSGSLRRFSLVSAAPLIHDSDETRWEDKLKLCRASL